MSGAPRGDGRSPLVPALACGVLAAAVRGAVAAAQWEGNPALRDPSLDAAYYLDWAREIASGHVLSAGPVGASGPYLLNPLYAWVLAPIVAMAATPQPLVMALQAALGGATAGLSAEAARRHAGAAAAWIAGLAVAFSSALVHLSTHVSVATLAAFLVAGAVLSCAPPRRPDDRGSPRSAGIAAGLWLGVGALARPVTLLALPLVAWAQAVRAGRAPGAPAAPRAPTTQPPAARHAAAWTVALFAACACVSFARNLAVSGEPVVFTAADGINLHLGNNEFARRTRTMISNEFRFAPLEMHDDARHRVGLALGREPSRADVSAWYRDATLGEIREHPGASLAFYAQKLRWFLSPAEPPSSADLEIDTERVPAVRAGFVPTWLLAVLAIAGAWLARRDRTLLLGAGGLALAHAATCALAFPLSHYRAPAIPALAVLAGVGLATAMSRAAAGSAVRRDRIVACGLAAAAAVAAWLPPQPARLMAVLHVNRAADALRAGDGPAALEEAAAALEEEPGWAGARFTMANAQLLAGRVDLARIWTGATLEVQPWNIPAARFAAELDLDLGRRDAALAAVEALVAKFPWSAEARGTRGEIRAFTDDAEGARQDLTWAMDRGHRPHVEVLQRLGMAPR